MRQWRLRTSLILLLVVTILITFTIVGSSLLAVRLPAISQDMISTVQQQSLSLSRVVEQLLVGLESRLGTGIRLIEKKAVDQQQLLDALLAEDGFSAVYLLTKEGRVRVLALSGQSVSQRSALVGLDLSGTELFQAAKKRQGAVWSDRYLSVLRAQPVVGVAFALPDGVLVAELNSDDLAQTIQAAALQAGSLVLVVDSHGDWVADQGLNKSLRFHNWGDELSRLAAVVGTERAYLDVHSVSHYAGHSHSAKLGWSFVVATPAYWENPRYRSTILLVIGGLFSSLFFGSLIAPLWAKIIARPLNDIIHRTQALADGRDEEDAFPKGRISELNQLSSNLEHMSNSIRQREMALRLSEERLRATIETTPSLAIQWYDRSGRVVYWNPASEVFYGYSAAEAIGRKIDELIVSPEIGKAFMDFIKRIEQTGEVVGPVEVPTVHKNGRVLEVLCTVFSIPDAAHGKLYACMDVDLSAVKQAEVALRQLNSELEERVTERTQDLKVSNSDLTKAMLRLQLTQAELIQSEKLAALGGLVAGIAHELNTPIGNGVMAVTTLRELAQTFRSEVENGLKRSSLIAFVDNVDNANLIAERNLQRAADLVASFKQVAVDQTSSQYRQFKLSDVVAEILLTLQPTLRRTPYEIKVAVPDEIIFASYPGPLGQVLTNLINNAVKHGFDQRDRGVINIRAEVTEPGWIKLQVQDDGQGIPASLLPRIFDPFVTTRLGSGGSGLGLHIVFNTVTGLLCGQINVTSEEGIGTTFEMSLPMQVAETRQGS